jgi:serine/threonine protein kinase
MNSSPALMRPQEVVRQEGIPPKERTNLASLASACNRGNDGAFDIDTLIGYGSYAQVYLVRQNVSSGQVPRLYALKVIKKDAENVCADVLAYFKSEVAIHRRMRHPCVVSLHGEDEGPLHHALLLDYIPSGDLYETLGRSHECRLGIPAARAFAAHLTLGLRYLHEECMSPDHFVIHRDLKPENVLIDARAPSSSSLGVAKLSDFGFAKQLKTGGRCYSFVGTPDYLAPEVLHVKLNQGPEPAGTGTTAYRYGYDKAVDWWGLGILVFEMLEG